MLDLHTSFTARLFRLGIAAALALLICATPLIAIPSSAQAAGASRTSLPIVAGTKLTFSQPPHPGTYAADSYCTAGAVFKSTTYLSRLLPYSAASRYVLTAKHCGQVGADVSVGEDAVGKVIWASPDRDLELIKVDPEAHRNTHCGPTYGGASRCSVIQTFTPRAVGKIILDLPYTLNFERAIPIAGVGTPTNTTRICTSGYRTGPNCTFRLVNLPPREEEQAKARGQKVMRSESAGTDQGDSGGPVSDPSGVLFGIHHGSADPTRFANVGIYTPISEFLTEQPNYALAPAS
ncbi:S1 family peptidase (plasmid) [Clavibacter capsici]|uniref:S1 family peptidase n=1 Tax=Clavibacter capsici TaxID=1874630 RepID=A0AAE6XTL6_9MICO|nr:S1 family peptidase [Clavibacter capsici]QIS43584.1 S1 family peptidase [Clavibacter capsici]QIS46524.1 S1 family peptidase [Clavibacter capsici]